MKRTTYIMTGMLVAGLVLVCGTIFYLSRCCVAWEDTFWEIGGSRKTVQLPPCRVVKLTQPATVWKQKREGLVECERSFSFGEVPLTVTSGDSLQGSFSCAGDMESFVSITSVGDTLAIAFDFPEDKLEERFRGESWIKLRSAGLALDLPAGVQEVLVDVESMETTFKGVCRDTFSFRVREFVRVEDCRFTSLSAQARTLCFNSGEVRDLHLNLDEISSWIVGVDSFRIDTEHLSGSHYHDCYLQKGECRQVLWTPLGDDATLEMKLRHAGKIELNEQL